MEMLVGMLMELIGSAGSGLARPFGRDEEEADGNWLEMSAVSPGDGAQLASLLLNMLLEMFGAPPLGFLPQPPSRVFPCRLQVALYAVLQLQSQFEGWATNLCCHEFWSRVNGCLAEHAQRALIALVMSTGCM